MEKALLEFKQMLMDEVTEIQRLQHKHTYGKQQDKTVRAVIDKHVDNLIDIIVTGDKKGKVKLVEE